MATITSFHSPFNHVEWLVRASTQGELAEAIAGVRRANPQLQVRFSMPFLEQGQVTAIGTSRDYEETPK